MSSRDEAVELSGICPANQLRQEKEHHNQLAATLQDSPFLHLGAPKLTSVCVTVCVWGGGLVLWSVRTVDCYSRFDAADAQPKRNYFNGHDQRRGRGKKS